MQLISYSVNQIFN